MALRQTEIHTQQLPRHEQKSLEINTSVDALLQRLRATQRALTTAIPYYYMQPESRDVLRGILADTQAYELQLHAVDPQKIVENAASILETIDRAEALMQTSQAILEQRLRSMGVESSETFFAEVLPAVTLLDQKLIGLQKIIRKLQDHNHLQTPGSDGHIEIEDHIQTFLQSRWFETVRELFATFTVKQKEKMSEFPEHRLAERAIALLGTLQIPSNILDLHSMVDTQGAVVTLTPYENPNLTETLAQAELLEVIEHVITVALEKSLTEAALRSEKHAQTPDSADSSEVPYLQKLDQPQMVLVSGPAAAGKSRFTQEFSSKFLDVVVNTDPDDLKPLMWNLLREKRWFHRHLQITEADTVLHDFLNQEFQEDNYFMVYFIHEFSALASKLLLSAALKQKYSIIDQRTFTNPDRYEAQVKLAMQEGYELALVSMPHVSLAETLRRVVAQRPRGYAFDKLIHLFEAKITELRILELGAKKLSSTLTTL